MTPSGSSPGTAPAPRCPEHPQDRLSPPRTAQLDPNGHQPSAAIASPRLGSGKTPANRLPCCPLLRRAAHVAQSVLPQAQPAQAAPWSRAAGDPAATERSHTAERSPQREPTRPKRPDRAPTNPKPSLCCLTSSRPSQRSSSAQHTLRRKGCDRAQSPDVSRKDLVSVSNQH